MTYGFYKLVHLFGVLFLLVAVGGLAVLGATGDPMRDRSLRRLLAIVHGVSLVVILVAGFGLLARIGLAGVSSWPSWVWGKLAVWLLFGASIVVLKRRPASFRVMIIALPTLATLGAWLAVYKPG